jgi:ADP-ribose pyrophosphatase
MKASPKIVSRKVLHTSPWMQLIEKEVKFSPAGKVESFYCLTQEAYVGILTQTAEGLIPLVRQYRPCVEDYTWEFPGGTLDPGETAEEAARRELLEEAGLEVLELRYLGNFYPDTGRLQLDSHAFYARTTVADKNFIPEEGMAIQYVSPKELRQMMLAGTFRHQLHWAIYAAVLLHGIDLEGSANNRQETEIPFYECL